jgi:hypothetical protein
MKAPFCQNSRVWLDFCFYGAPKSCPYQSGKDCIYERCGYFEEKEASAYYKRKMKILQSFSKEENL